MIFELSLVPRMMSPCLLNLLQEMYPVHVRSLVIDQFQELIEEDLCSLHH